MRLLKLSVQQLLHYCLYLLVLILPFQTHYVLSASTNQYAIQNLYLFDLLFLIILVLFVVFWYAHKPKLHVAQHVLWLAAAICVSVGLSAYWSNSHAVSFYYWLHFLEAIIVFVIALYSEVPVPAVLTALTLDGMIQTGFAIWQTLTQHVTAIKWFGISAQNPATSGTPVVLTVTGRFLRAFGTLPHPNIAGGLIVLGLVSSVIVWQHVKQPAWKHLYLASTLVCTLGLVLTFSRTAIIVWIASCALFLITQRKLMTPVIASLVLLIVLGGCYFSMFESRILAQDYAEQNSLQQRSTQVIQAVNLFKLHWSAGIGIGQYTSVAPLVDGKTSEPVHVLPLLLLVELGVIPTLLLYLWLVTIVLSTDDKHQLSVGLTIMSLSILGLECLDHYFWTLPTMLILWFLLLGLQVRSGKLAH